MDRLSQKIQQNNIYISWYSHYSQLMFPVNGFIQRKTIMPHFFHAAVKAPGLPSCKALFLHFQANPRSSRAGFLRHDVPSFPASLSLRHHGVAVWTVRGSTVGTGGHGEVYKLITADSLYVYRLGKERKSLKISLRRVSVSPLMFRLWFVISTNLSLTSCLLLSKQTAAVVGVNGCACFINEITR